MYYILFLFLKVKVEESVLKNYEMFKEVSDLHPKYVFFFFLQSYTYFETIVQITITNNSFAADRLYISSYLMRLRKILARYPVLPSNDFLITYEGQL